MAFTKSEIESSRVIRLALEDSYARNYSFVRKLSERFTKEQLDTFHQMIDYIAIE